MTEVEPKKEALLKIAILSRFLIDDVLEMIGELNARLKEYVKTKELRELTEDDLRYNIRQYNSVVYTLLDTLHARLRDYVSVIMEYIESDKITAEDALLLIEEMKKRRGLDRV